MGYSPWVTDLDIMEHLSTLYYITLWAIESKAHGSDAISEHVNEDAYSQDLEDTFSWPPQSRTTGE